MEIIKDEQLREFRAQQESQFFVDYTDRADDIVGRFKDGVQHHGDPLPWHKTHDKVRLRPGEVSVWAGINGHGKSLVLSHVTVPLMFGTNVLIASLEMTIAATGHRMLRQLGGTATPTESYIREMLEWTKGKLWLYDQLDTVASDRIIAMCHYAITKHGINHIIIDSLMKCGIRNDDFDGQKKFVDALCWIAKTYKVHIHLVHHMRKGENEDTIPDKFDVRGAGEIVDLVDNLFIVHRNKKKERDVAAGTTVEPHVPDTTLRVAKQRHGEWEGDIALYLEKGSTQFIANCEHHAFRYEMHRH